MKKALALSGGGAKGSYQLGVWKALRRLNYKFDIVTGVSIGSINGAMIVQNKYHLAKKIWLTITTDKLFDVEVGGKFSFRALGKIFGHVIHGGMKYDRAEFFLKKYINEKKIRKSKIKYGLGTYSIKTKTPKDFTIDNIPEGKLIDYILASSTVYPLIEKKSIDDDFLIDGGFHDCIPINLAIDMGADEVLAVDLNVLSKVQKVKDKDIKVEVIKAKDPKKITLTFEPGLARKGINYGYNDTMKHFGKLDGNIFTFRRNHIINNSKKLEKIYVNILKDILLTEKRGKIVTEIFKISKYNKIFKNIKENKRIDDILFESLEYLGILFELNQEKIYSINKFNRLLLKNVKKLSYLKIDKNLKGKMLIGYIYNKYLLEKENPKLRKELFNLALIFSKEFLATVYLLAISKKYVFSTRTDEFYKDILDLLKAGEKSGDNKN